MPQELIKKGILPNTFLIKTIIIIIILYYMVIYILFFSVFVFSVLLSFWPIYSCWMKKSTAKININPATNAIEAFKADDNYLNYDINLDFYHNNKNAYEFINIADIKSLIGNYALVRKSNE
jgi:ABC-type transport system involved in Fe-S cluster assembly fused permease/ATPase subunit